MPSPHTLTETEEKVVGKLGRLPLDFEAMAVVSNLFRAANATRNYLERSVLAATGLSWTAFVVLWVTWIWEPIETRQIAEEGGFSKATLTGVLGTLESKGYLLRERSDKDGRLVNVSMTPAGRELMATLFPTFNDHERTITSSLDPERRRELADMLRAITLVTEGQRSDSTEGQRSDSTEGQRSDSTEGQRSDSTEGQRSDSTEGQRLDSTEGQR